MSKCKKKKKTTKEEVMKYLILILICSCTCGAIPSKDRYEGYVVIFKSNTYMMIGKDGKFSELGYWSYYFKNYNLNDTIK